MDIKIKNPSSANVTVVLEDIHYRRQLHPMAEALITKEVYEAMKYDAGCVNMIREGYLTFILPPEMMEEDKPEPELLKEVQIPTSIKKLLKEGTITDLAKLLKTATDAEKETIVSVAISESVADPARCKLIKDNCGVDVIKAMSLQRAE